MGLLPANRVGPVRLLRDMTAIVPPYDFTGTPVYLTIDDFIAAEGPRIPAAKDAQKHWRQAFCVITKNAKKAGQFVNQVDDLRLRWPDDFRRATKGLGNIDTGLEIAETVAPTAPTAPTTPTTPLNPGLNVVPSFASGEFTLISSDFRATGDFTFAPKAK